MLNRNCRRGHVARVLTMALTIVLGIPATVTLLAFVSFQPELNAQQVTIDEIAVATTADQSQEELDETEEGQEQNVAVIVTRPGESLRPVTETFYEEQKIAIQVPVFDAKTGEQKFQTRQQIVRVPRTRVLWSRNFTAQNGGKVQELVEAIGESDEDDADKDAKMKELRDVLLAEFNRMHEEQANQIRETTERLAKLKSVHDERMKNRDTIVQRRIDQLLGQPDPLQWNPNPPEWITRNHFSRGVGIAPVPAVTSSPVAPGQNVWRSNTITKSGTRVESTSPAVPPGPPGAPVASTIIQRIANAPTAASSPTPATTVVGGFAIPRPTAKDQQEVAVASLFDAVREAAKAEADLKVAMADLKRIRALHEKGALGITDLRQIELAIVKHRQATEIAKMQLDLFQSQLRKEVESAKIAYDQATDQMQILTEKFKSGLEPRDRLSESEYQLKQAENMLEMSELRMSQFQKALKMLNNADAVEEDSDESAVDESDVDGSEN